jgi:hypothetical protein
VALPREERQTNEFNALENGLGKKCLIVFQGVSEWSPKLESDGRLELGWLPVGSPPLQQARGGNKILRFKALGEFLIDRFEQSNGLGRTPGRDPVRGKIGSDIRRCKRECRGSNMTPYWRRSVIAPVSRRLPCK